MGACKFVSVKCGGCVQLCTLVAVVLVVHCTQDGSTLTAAVSTQGQPTTRDHGDPTTNYRQMDCQNKTFNVSVGIKIFEILGIDANTQILELKQALALQWDDPALVWEAEGIEPSRAHRYYPARSICFPDLTIDESVDTMITPPLNIRTDVRVSPAGHVNYYYPHMYRGVCRLDMTYYPFDTQHCKISLWSTLRTTEEVDVWPLTAKLTFTYFTENSEWRIIWGIAERKVEQ